MGSYFELQSLLHAWHDDRPIRQQNGKEHILDWTFNRFRKADEPERNRRRPKFLSFQRADLFVIKGGHEVCGDLCPFNPRLALGRSVLSPGQPPLATS